MFNFIKIAVISAWIVINRNSLLKLAFAAVLGFFAHFFYQEWKELYLSNPDALFLILVIFNILVVMILIWMFFILKEFVKTKDSEKILEANKSFKDLPKDYQDIENVELRPDLRRRHD